MIVLSLLLLAGVEKAGRFYPRVMPPDWQLLHIVTQFKTVTVPDPEIGFLWTPKQHEVIRTPDYEYIAETDSNGFPNAEPWPAHPTIVFLGDSLLTGPGVGLAGSFTNLIAQMLPDQPLVNLGLAAAGVARESVVYRRFGVPLRARLVVACLYLASDFDNDLHFVSWERQNRTRDYNTYRLEFARAQHPRGWLDQLLDKSWLYGTVKESVMRWIKGTRYVRHRHTFPDGTEILFESGHLQFATEEVAPDDLRVNALMESIEALRKSVAEQDAQLVVMLIPSKEELFAVPSSYQGFNVMALTRQRLREAKIPVLDLYPDLQRRGAERPPYWALDIHLNTFGNRIVAENFVDWFRRQPPVAMTKTGVDRRQTTLVP